MISEDALGTRVSGGILVEACRSESDDVGVGWGKDWGKRSKSSWRLPGHRDVASDLGGARAPRGGNTQTSGPPSPACPLRAAATRALRVYLLSGARARLAYRATLVGAHLRRQACSRYASRTLWGSARRPRSRAAPPKRQDFGAADRAALSRGEIRSTGRIRQRLVLRPRLHQGSRASALRAPVGPSPFMRRSGRGETARLPRTGARRGFPARARGPR